MTRTKQFQALSVLILFFIISCSKVNSNSVESTSVNHKIFYFSEIDSVSNYRLIEFDTLTSITKVIGLENFYTSVDADSSIVHNSKVYFTAYKDGNGHPWVFDPTKEEVVGENPKLLVDLSPTFNDSSDPGSYFSIGGLLYFVASVDGYGKELVVYDDSKAVSLTNPEVIDLRAGTSSSSPKSVIFVGDKIYFKYHNGIVTDAVGVYDTSQPVSGSNPSTLFSGIISANDIIELDNKLYFEGNNGSDGNELFVFDLSLPESVTNPSQVYDIRAGANSSNLGPFTTDGDTLFFKNSTGTQGLWSYDPNQPSSATNPKNVLALSGMWGFHYSNNKIFFSGDDSGPQGDELWIMDTSQAASPGTNPQVYDLNTGAGDSDASSYIDCYDGKVCFSATVASDNKNKLHIIDPTNNLPEATDINVIDGVSDGDGAYGFSLFSY